MMNVLNKWKQSAGNLCLAALSVFAVISIIGCASVTPPRSTTQFVYTSDSHYGITRDNYPTIGAPKADAHTVNAAMVGMMNALPTVILPCHDNGVNACKPVGAIDFVANTGDIANRMEVSANVHSAAESWHQFQADYIEGLTLKDKNNNKSPLFIVPGNHDVSNAIGFYKKMSPAKDATSMAEIFNRTMNPSVLRTQVTYKYDTDKVFYAEDMGGVHFVFINMWPDSAARAWMEADFAKVATATPVVIFAHDQPNAESKHFTNPNGANDINSKDMFENLLVDKFTDAATVNDGSGNPVPSVIEQRAWAAFLKEHKNIVAYFHGNDNYNQFYTYQGPDNTVNLNTFRVDSPMKGAKSASDPGKLSFQVVSIDEEAKTMTVREYLWNTRTWGEAITVSLAPRSK